MSSDSDIIYHYCSLDAFVSIVKSRSIWLTNIFYMNDSEEHYWLRRKAREVAEELRENSTDEVAEECLESFVAQLFPKEDDTDIYCACFSKDGDSLAQWRAYADDGRGVAIGFSRKTLECLSESFVGLEIHDVVYNPDGQKEIVRKLLQEELAARRGSDDDGDLLSSYLRLIAEMAGRLTIAVYLWKEAARCKNPAFDLEKEVRMVYHPPHVEPGRARGFDPPSPIQMRAKGDVLVPYYSLALTDLPIREVRFGPKSDFKRNRPAAQIHLSSAGYKKDSVELSQSTASYR